MKSKVKRRISGILFGLIFLIGFGVLMYPTVSNQWNTYRQSKLINHYQQVVSQMKEEDFSAEWEKARAYNDAMTYNALYDDAFGTGTEDLKSTEYWKVLNVAGDGVMGYLSIPDIKVKLAIYHGSDETVLQTGVGHINGTKLPIGGNTNHTVLAAHRGLPSARLFTDIDQLEKGDVFYIYMMNETLAYQVDQILDMVDKDDAAALGEALALEEGKDYVSLFTCTPYGVNSHRLIVRGTRIPYEEEIKEEVKVSAPEAMLESVQNYYSFYLIFGLSVTFLLIVIMKFFMGRKRRKARREAKKVEKEAKF